MSRWLTVQEFMDLTESARAQNMNIRRIELLIENIETQALALGLDTMRTGFLSAAKTAILQAVETAIELSRPVKSETMGRRSATYDRDAVRKTLIDCLSGYITGGTIRLV